MHDILTAMPWSNTIDVVTISGHTLKSVLEHAVSSYRTIDPSGRFLQVSGLILTFDVRHPPGQRLLSAYAGHPSIPESCQPLNDSALYEVAVPSFLASGGDTFKMIPDSMVEYKNTGFLDSDLLVAFLRKNDPLQLPESGRLVVLSTSNPVVDASLAAKGHQQHLMITLSMLLMFVVAYL